MILKQYYLGCLSHASYLVGDRSTGRAVVIDPQRDIDHYLEDAADMNLSIDHVFLTHFHADFLAGHLELRERTGARIHLGARAEAEYDFAAMENGDTVSLGQVRFTFLETPGHTPEGVCILVHETPQSETPHAIFTGDTLFVGDVGRPDLMASVGTSAETLAELLYDSIHERILPLPDATLIYPAHGAGSMCGKNLGPETFSTLGRQRAVNPSLQPMSRGEFIQRVTADLPPAPAYFAYDAVLNRRERPVLDLSLEAALTPLSFEDLLHRHQEGAQVIDTRDPWEFCRGHLKGSISIGLRGSYATWAGTLLHHDTPILVIAEPGQEAESAMRLGRIGFDHVGGYLNGGPDAFRMHPELVRVIRRHTVTSLARSLEDDPPPLVLDVRTHPERSLDSIPDSLHVPLNQLLERLPSIPRDRMLVTQCRSGYRSVVAASLLLGRGFPAVEDLDGGILAWVERGAPTVAGAPAAI